MDKTVLITYFEPFGGEHINSAGETCKALPDKIASFNLYKLEIPTVFEKAASVVIKKIEAIKPDYVIMLGQAGGRDKVTPEKIAINYIDARIEDNDGNKPSVQKISEFGPDGIFTNIDVERIVASMKDEGYNINISLSAGAFVCNDTFYRVAYYLKDSECGFNFIHVPFLPQQAKNEYPSMELDNIVKTIKRYIELL